MLLFLQIEYRLLSILFEQDHRSVFIGYGPPLKCARVSSVADEDRTYYALTDELETEELPGALLGYDDTRRAYVPVYDLARVVQKRDGLDDLE